MFMLFVKAIIIAIPVLIILGIIEDIRESRALSKIKLPDFPPTSKDGTALMNTVLFSLAGVNHIHDGSNPQEIIKPTIKGQWLTLKADPNNNYDNTAVKVLYDGKYIGWLPNSNASLAERDAKSMIFNRLARGLEVRARFDTITCVQIGGWDLDDLDAKMSEHEFNSAIITCGIYNLPNGRHPKSAKVYSGLTPEIATPPKKERVKYPPRHPIAYTPPATNQLEISETSDAEDITNDKT